jgi:hypothetical protein
MSIDKMISAKEAHKQTTNNKNAILNRELFEIESKIKDAIKYGRFECMIDSPISEEAMNILKECGYEIKQGNQYNICYTNIKW